MKRFFSSERAFTILELIVVVLIIGILIAVAAPSFLGNQDKAYNSETKQGLANLYKHARSDFTLSDGVFTTDEQAFVDKVHPDEPGIPFTNTATPDKGEFGICEVTPSRVVLVGNGRNGKSFTMTTDKDGAYKYTEETCVSYASAVLKDEPWAYWRFNSGDLLADSSGNGRPLTSMSAGVTSVPGPITSTSDDSALKFSAGHSASANGVYVLNATSFTIETWARIDSPSNLANYSRLMRMTGSPVGSYAINICGTSYPGCGTRNVWGEFGGNEPAATGIAISSTPTYHHYVLTYSASTSTLQLYIDGSSIGSATVVNPGAFAFSNFSIIPSFGSPGDTFSIDETAIYNKALSPARVLAHYDAREPE